MGNELYFLFSSNKTNYLKYKVFLNYTKNGLKSENGEHMTNEELTWDPEESGGIETTQ